MIAVNTTAEAWHFWVLDGMCVDNSSFNSASVEIPFAWPTGTGLTRKYPIGAVQYQRYLFFDGTSGDRRTGHLAAIYCH